MNCKLFVIFACTWSKLFCLVVVPSERNERIVGGTKAKRNQFPYVVGLFHGMVLRCGGAIISHKWVVSAAHCFSDEKYESGWVAAAGLLHKNERDAEVQRRSVVKIVSHENYMRDLKNNVVENDIALLQLVCSLRITPAVQPVKLPQPNQQFSGTAWVCGWGRINIKEKPETLQYLQMEVITNEECKHIRTKYAVTPPFKILDTILCTTLRTGNSTACYGDSGGPLAQNGVLIGIVSFGDRNCGTDLVRTTAGFTRVTRYIEFIKSYAKDEKRQECR